MRRQKSGATLEDIMLDYVAEYGKYLMSSLNYTKQEAIAHCCTMFGPDGSRHLGSMVVGNETISENEAYVIKPVFEEVLSALFTALNKPPELIFGSGPVPVELEMYRQYIEKIYTECVGCQVFVTWKVSNFASDVPRIIPGVAGLAMRDCEMAGDAALDVINGQGVGTPVCLLATVLEPIIKLGGLVYIGDNYGA